MDGKGSYLGRPSVRAGGYRKELALTTAGSPTLSALSSVSLQIDFGEYVHAVGHVILMVVFFVCPNLNMNPAESPVCSSLRGSWQ